MMLKATGVVLLALVTGFVVGLGADKIEGPDPTVPRICIGDTPSLPAP
jgi:hypothetical protein